jgi:hypothetical protein
MHYELHVEILSGEEALLLRDPKRRVLLFPPHVHQLYGLGTSCGEPCVQPFNCPAGAGTVYLVEDNCGCIGRSFQEPSGQGPPT